MLPGSLHFSAALDEDNCCIEEEEVLDVDDWYDATEDKFETGSFMMQKTGLVDHN